MSQKQGRSQKPRKQKTSHGVNRGSKKERPPVQLLIAMGKGPAHESKAKFGYGYGKRESH